MGKKSDDGIKVSDLAYYFDAQERDRLDRGGLGRKSGQVLMLRERLLQLPDAQFDLAVRTLEQMVATARREEAAKPKSPNPGPREALDLYQEAAQSGKARGERPDLKISVI